MKDSTGCKRNTVPGPLRAFLHDPPRGSGGFRVSLGMKKNTSRHPKMLALARELDIPRTHARGILGELWEWSGDFALFGDIGKHGNDAIAAAVDWRGKADDLVAALVACGWIDEVDDDRRLVLHDWEDGCDQWVKKRLLRARDADAAANGGQRLPTADGGRPVKKGRGEKSKDKDKKGDAEMVEAIYAAYPKHVGKTAAIKAIRVAAGKAGVDALLERTKLYSGIVGGVIGTAGAKFVPHPATWFNQGRYDDDQDQWRQFAQDHAPPVVAKTVTFGAPAPDEAEWHASVFARSAKLTDQQIVDAHARMGPGFVQELETMGVSRMRRDVHRMNEILKALNGEAG